VKPKFLTSTGRKGCPSVPERATKKYKRESKTKRLSCPSSRQQGREKTLPRGTVKGESKGRKVKVSMGGRTGGDRCWHMKQRNRSLPVGDEKGRGKAEYRALKKVTREELS